MRLFNQWIRAYKSDIKGKVNGFIEENDTTPEELADVIDVPVEEIYDILEGNGEEISVETFGKLLLASGFAIRIEPVENSPLEHYGNVNPDIMMEDAPFHHPVRNVPPMHEHRPFGMPIPPRMGERPCPPPPPHAAIHQHHERKSPFDNMTRAELVRIIKNKLWDSEIDTRVAPIQSLIDFLKDKDERMQRVVRESRNEQEESLDNDPSVTDFLSKLRKNVEENPQVKKFLKGLLDNA